MKYEEMEKIRSSTYEILMIAKESELYDSFSNEEDLKIVENAINDYLSVKTQDVKELIDRNTLKKPIRYKEHNKMVCWQCPACEIFKFTSEMYDFCPDCGQKLDWSDGL